MAAFPLLPAYLLAMLPTPGFPVIRNPVPGAKRIDFQETISSLAGSYFQDSQPRVGFAGAAIRATPDASSRQMHFMKKKSEIQ